MRILVIGAGIIGTIYGWALARGDHEVVHLVRPGRGADLREGLALDIYKRGQLSKRSIRTQYLLHAVETLSETTIDLVIVPVKHYGLLPTLRDVVPKIGAAEFLLLTQNWHGSAEIDVILPRTRYIYGDAKAGGSFSDGKLVAALSAIDLGPAEGDGSPLAAKAASLFSSAGIAARLHANMLHYLWVQYAITAGMWAALIGAGSFEALLSHRDATDKAQAAVRECLAVAKQRGVALAQYPETRPFLTNSALARRIYFWLARRMFRKDEYTRRSSAHAFGDAVEVKTFYDDLVGTGRELGIAMPVMASYAAAVGRFADQAHMTGGS